MKTKRKAVFQKKIGKHTSGSWFAIDCSIYCCSIKANTPSGFFPVAEVYLPEGDEANARLISAAPDLLEACKLAMIDELSCKCDGLVCIALRKAIAKAEGKGL